MWNELSFYTEWPGLLMIVLCLSIVAVLCVKRSWLTLGGAIAMIVMGAIIDVAFGIKGLTIIFIFFLSSNLVGKLARSGQNPAPHAPRTLKQVFANGGVPLFSALYVALGGSLLFGLGCFLASIASATADTWASEVGSQRAGKPYHLAIGKKVEPGLSGAITFLGTSIGGLGAVLISCVSLAFYFQVSIESNLFTFLIIALVGWGGQWMDTLFGAYFQARFECHVCGVLTDDSEHCGKEARRVHGFSWVTNDVVNAASSILAGLFGGLFFLFFLEGNYFVI
jgi:uncharacterized protein (TIGR00297 family)